MLRLNWTHEQTWYVRCGCVVPAMACMASSHSTQHSAPSTQHTQITVVHRTLGLALHCTENFSVPKSQISIPRNQKGQREKSNGFSPRWADNMNRIESSSANQSIIQIGRKLVNGTNLHKAAQPRAQQTLHSNGATTEGATAVHHRECLCSKYKRRHQIDTINNSHFTPLLYC